MIDRAESERLMLTRETGYIEELKDSCGPLSAEILGVMSGLYRAGWRDCWEAEAVHDWNKRIDQAIETSKQRELSSLAETPTE